MLLVNIVRLTDDLERTAQASMTLDKKVVANLPNVPVSTAAGLALPAVDERGGYG